MTIADRYNWKDDHINLLISGLAAAEGARVLADCYFERDGRDGDNNDNYCRLIDWIEETKSFLEKQKAKP